MSRCWRGDGRGGGATFVVERRDGCPECPTRERLAEHPELRRPSLTTNITRCIAAVGAIENSGERSSMRSALALAVTTLLAACGDSPLGPDDVDLSGSWSYSATIGQDGGDCRIEDAPMSVRQDGDMLSGTLAIGAVQCGDVTCEGGDTLESVALTSGRHRDAGSVEFEAGFLDHGGTASSNRMEGKLLASRVELSCSDPEGSSTVLVESGSGTWEARRSGAVLF
jgi:hypothetical protein